MSSPMVDHCSKIVNCDYHLGIKVDLLEQEIKAVEAFN